MFVGPDAGGLKVKNGGAECTVITPESPLGRALLGRVCDDEIQVDQGGSIRTYTVIALA